MKNVMRLEESHERSVLLTILTYIISTHSLKRKYFHTTKYKMASSDQPQKEKNKTKPAVEPRVIKTTTDLQRFKLEKLMKNPDKPIVIPERPKQKQMPNAPDFVRNVMGSSAGAGSGEFHVYRHLRRKEYARQKFIQEKSEQEKLDEEYHKKLEENQQKSEQKTAKKRAKRMKKKKNAKSKSKKTKQDQVNVDSNESESDDNDEDDTKESHSCGKSESAGDSQVKPYTSENTIMEDENKKYVTVNTGSENGDIFEQVTS